MSQAFFEHKVSENLIEVPTVEADKLAARVRDFNFNDPFQQEAIIADTLSSLAAHNTDTWNGTEFTGIEEYILELMSDQLNRGDVSVVRMPHKTEDGKILKKNSLIFIPGDSSDLAVELQNRIDLGSLNEEPLFTDKVLIHVHTDTVGTLTNGMAGLKTYYDPEKNLCYCRGACDMKGSIATIPFIYEKLLREGSELPIFVFTADEEVENTLGGLELLRSIRSRKLNLDLEPTICVPGTIVTELLPSYTVVFEDLDDVRPIKMHKIMETLGKYFDRNSTHAFIYTDCGTLSVNLMSQGFFESPDLTAQEVFSSVYPFVSINGNELKGAYQIGVKHSEGVRSSVNGRIEEAIKSALKKTYQFQYEQNKPVSALTRGIPNGRVFFGRHFTSKLFANFTTAIINAHGNLTPWGVLGPDEKGGCRHSSNEGVDLSELRQLGDAVAEIVKQVHAIH